MKLKNDKYRKARGGKTKVLKICCAKCSETVILYQKDGDGSLHRSYLNRITGPDELVGLEKSFSNTSEMFNLVCKSCSQLIGIPMKHTDGRLAFRLIKGNYSKTVLK